MQSLLRTALLFLAGWAASGPFTISLAAQTETDWAQFRGPGGLGVATAKGLPLEWDRETNIVWKKELPGPGGSTPILLGDRIFLTCYSGYNVPGGPRGSMQELKRHVVCLDRATGKLLWDTSVEAKLPEQETIREGHGYATNSPAVDSKHVYVFLGKSGVFAFDHSGRKVWQADVGSQLNRWGSAASPILFGDLVIVNASVESASLVALNKKTGKEVWRAKGITESWNTPILVPLPGGKTELVVAIQGKVLGFDPATGDSLWSCATDIGWYMVPSLVLHEDVILCIGGRSGGSLAVRAGGRGNVTRTHRLWTGRKGSNVTSPVAVDGYLYWAHENNGIAYCAEARTGKIVYEERLGRAGQVYASAIAADGKLYYVTRNGRTFVLPAKPRFEKLAVNELSDRSTFNASPAIAGNRLFLRSDRYLYCIGKR